MSWSGQDWAYVLGGIAFLLTTVGGFITQMVTLHRVGEVAKKVDGILVDRDASNVAIGRLAGDEASAQRAEGRRQEREINREVAALTPHLSGAPLPVTDEKTTAAVQNVADAIENGALPKKV